MSYYDYLNERLPTFFEKVGVNWDTCAGIVSAHGDKGYGYQYKWEEAGIAFEHGMCVYLLTHVFPYGNEVREQQNQEWIAPGDWVVDNFHRFKDALEETDLEFE